jgi:hypothetical protein
MLDLIARVVAIANLHGIAENPIPDIVHGYARRDRFQ